jgi:hypothetical protein
VVPNPFAAVYLLINNKLVATQLDMHTWNQTKARGERPEVEADVAAWGCVDAPQLIFASYALLVCDQVVRRY